MLKHSLASRRTLRWIAVLAALPIGGCGPIPPAGSAPVVPTTINAEAATCRRTAALLQAMADRKILVEVALSSADAILGVKGRYHPLSAYLGAGVPVALATDDEGVLRSNITTEYRRAVEDQGIDYRTLKQMARNSIVYAFVEDNTKARLLNQLDNAFTRFEEDHAARQQPNH
ncbi:MAG: hypothetical protein ABIS03_09475 [Gemmatimonadaceae bacterium]